MQVFCPSLSCSLQFLTIGHVFLANGLINLMAASFPRNCDRNLTMITTMTMSTMMMVMMMMMMMGRVMVMVTKNAMMKRTTMMIITMIVTK